MNIKNPKKLIFNGIFLIVFVLMVYPDTREWIMRKTAFSPSINNADDAAYLASYKWDLKGVNTEDIAFEQLKGKVVFVNFWATWCPPCRAEMPMIQELYNDYKEKIAFILVTDEGKSKVQQYFDENDYDFPVYNNASSPPKPFSETNSIPASYIIDKSGTVIVDKVGAADWNSDKVRNLLDRLIK